MGKILPPKINAAHDGAARKRGLSNARRRIRASGVRGHCCRDAGLCDALVLYVSQGILRHSGLEARKKLRPDFDEADVHCDAVSILAVKETRIAPFRWDHINVWDCVYHIRADRCAAKLAYIKTSGRYCRCVLADFWNPTYEGRPFNGMFWGQPAMLAYGSGHLYNRLMYLENQFQSEAEMLADIENPEAIDFSGFFDDVFGDG